MTVYIVYRDYDWEGCSEPLAVFSSYEKAKAYVDRERTDKYQTWEIEVLMVDSESP